MGGGEVLGNAPFARPPPPPKYDLNALLESRTPVLWKPVCPPWIRAFIRYWESKVKKGKTRIRRIRRERQGGKGERESVWKECDIRNSLIELDLNNRFSLISRRFTMLYIFKRN